MRGKGIINNISTKFKVPGPGEYDHEKISINQSCRFPKSSFRNTTNIVWASLKEKRFNYKSKEYN